MVAAFDAADDLAASMQLGRVAVPIGGLVMNRMILMLAMIAATIATGAMARAQAPKSWRTRRRIVRPFSDLTR
jgi:hypothetical protein